MNNVSFLRSLDYFESPGKGEIEKIGQKVLEISLDRGQAIFVEGAGVCTC